MENAPDLVKAKADFVTASNTDHGVADALRRFVTE
jgi:hydroxymethylpyrimidine pyrophosphatase-like HAD family hydrolase